MTGIGFTGTREEPTEEQRDALYGLLRAKFTPGAQFLHGSADGADHVAHDLAMGRGYIVHVFPPIIPTYRAFVEGHHNYPEQPYAVRNSRIVALADELIAVPKTREEDAPRSGTWQTVRKARAKGIPITIIWPDGKVEEEVP